MMREWVNRAVAFTNSLKTFGNGSDGSAETFDPISIDELVTLQAALPVTIPPPYAEFLTSASSSLACYYTIVIYGEPTNFAKEHFADYLDLMQERIHGGPTFFNPKNLAGGIRQCFEGGEALLDVYPDSSKKWTTAFPLLNIGNADLVAFDVPENPKNPPIVYLCHDNNIVRTLAPDFESFLLEWEKINYIGLEIWDLEEWEFLDKSTGYLSADAGDLSGLQKKFEPPRSVE